MATKTHKKHIKNRFDNLTIRQVRRDAAVIASSPEMYYQTYKKPSYIKKTNLLKRLINVQDYRTFHPDPLPHPLNTSGTRARVIARNQLPLNKHRITSLPIKTFSPKITFEIPRKTAECVRRSVRREVIFARGSAGGKHKKPKFNDLSHISCKG